MKQLWYKIGFKSFGAILQGILAGVIIICIMNIYYWTEGSLNFDEMGKNFEQTNVFLQTVEDIVRSKIACQQNKELFERDGAYNNMQEVDIRQYVSGIMDETTLNLNTTYYICDLLEFHENGEEKMRERIQRLLVSGMSDQEVGEQLDAESGQLETILPISGSSLADYAKLSANSSGALVEYYQNLYETSQDIYRRYTNYQELLQDPGGESNNEAPSNVRYYVENTNTKQRYTNMGVKSLAAAQRMVQNDESLTFLYVGERKYNIMVSNTEYVMNEIASQWFIGARFLGTGEKVMLAVDLSYPIGDSLQSAHQAFDQREPVVMVSMIVGLSSLVLLVAFLIFSVTTAGRECRDGELKLNAFDQIPTEIAAGLCMIAGLLWALFISEISRYVTDLLPVSAREIVAVASVTEYEIFLFSFLSLIRRIKGRTLWHNSVCYAVAQGCSQVYSARKNSQRLLIAYVIFFGLNIVFLGFFGVSGVFMAVVIDMAVLLYLMRSEVGKQSIREGLYQISQGKLDYKIETDTLTGESLEMAEAVNEMGDGLKQAVDAIVRNERLKAELITNVSHDIKTPLTSIINYVDLLRREELHNEKAQEYIRVLEQKSQRLKQLTEDLIEASKINSGNIELHPMKIKLQQMLQQAYGEFAERLEEKNLEMTVRLEKEPVMIMADGRQLWRVLENLLSNIVKYAMPGTRVFLDMERQNELVKVIFRNVSAQKIEVSTQELQERFVRGDLSRNTEGSGLGLSIAKSLTELMDGTFELSLEGDYFQVILTFPVCEEK